jgi:hypothetical protein
MGGVPLQPSKGPKSTSNLSNDSKINEMCDAMLKSGRWTLTRHSKHPILRHQTKGASKFFIVPCTPSDPRAFANFRRDYTRYIRAFLIQTGVIYPQPETIN